MNIDWSKAPEGAIGAFSRGDGYISFVKTKKSSEYMNTPGYCGIKCDGNEYHVFTENWTWHERHASWNGEGLPPVGTVCESCVSGTDGWFKCSVLIHHPFEDGVAGVHDVVGHALLWTDTFRPTRTPEQIAAEEREKAITELAAELAGHWSAEAVATQRDMAAYLYDVGYRKAKE